MTPSPVSTGDRHATNSILRRGLRLEQVASGDDPHSSARSLDSLAAANLEEMDLNRLCDADSIEMF